MKIIQLAKTHKIALVDDADFDKVCRYRWFVDECNGVEYAASREAVPGKKVRLHRFILDLGEDGAEHVDHRNHDGLDCQRDNMRVCTQLNFGHAQEAV